MKLLPLRSLLIALPVFLGTAWLAQAEEVYEIDPAHSTISFKIRHLGISWVTGTFQEFAGKGVFHPDSPEKSSVEVIVQAASINTGNDKRDEHLRQPDYFHAEKHPTLSFKSSQVEKAGDNKYKVSGDFTMMGVTKPLEIMVDLTDSAEPRPGEVRRGGETTFKIKRSEFGMESGLGMIGDDVEVTISLAGVKK